MAPNRLQRDDVQERHVLYHDGTLLQHRTHLSHEDSPLWQASGDTWPIRPTVPLRPVGRRPWPALRTDSYGRPTFTLPPPSPPPPPPSPEHGVVSCRRALILNGFPTVFRGAHDPELRAHVLTAAESAAAYKTRRAAIPVERTVLEEEVEQAEEDEEEGQEEEEDLYPENDE